MVTVCRDCCCGTRSKHPEFDHDEQLATVRAGVAACARVRVSECLDVCERSNVMVVSPSAEGRRAGARPVWLSGVLDDEATQQVIDWVQAGGPGVSDPPDLLDLHVFAPSRRARKAAGQ